LSCKCARKGVEVSRPGLLATSNKLARLDSMLNHSNDKRIAHFFEHIVRFYSCSSFCLERAPMKSFNKSHTSCQVFSQRTQYGSPGDSKHQIVAFIRLPFFASSITFWLMLRPRSNESCDKLTNNNALFMEILHLDFCSEPSSCQRKQHFGEECSGHDAESNESITTFWRKAESFADSADCVIFA
jgi:hypothetical protein